MNDDSLARRVLDAVLGSSDAEGDPTLEEELADHPGLLRRYRELLDLWTTLGEMPTNEPPAGARERAGRALLRATGRRPGAGPRQWQRRVLNAAAIFVFFGAGVGVGAWWAGPDEPPLPTSESPADVPRGSRYVILIRGGELPPDDEEATRAMAGWARELWSADRLLWAERLFADGAARVGGDPAATRERPPVGGLFVIRAENREQAIRLASGAPNLAWGGEVEVLPTAVSAGR